MALCRKVHFIQLEEYKYERYKRCVEVIILIGQGVQNVLGTITVHLEFWRAEHTMGSPFKRIYA